MNTNQTLTQVLLPMLLLAGILAAIAVRCIGTICSRRVRESVRRHPVAHVLWMFGGLVAILILLAWLFPHISNRPALFQGHMRYDKVIAVELSRSPQSWTVSIDDELKSRLAPFELDVNEQVRRALQTRGETGWASSQGLLFGFSSMVILFCLVGLYRERSLEKLRKRIEGSASSALGSGDVAA